MSNDTNNWYVASRFAQDLVSHFFLEYYLMGMPIRDGVGNRVYFSELNDNIFHVITYFTCIPTEPPCYEASKFHSGYNFLDFLHYCGKVVYKDVKDRACGKLGYKEATNHAAYHVTLCLTEFMNSGEFESKGGWPGLKEMCCKLSAFHVFESVIRLGNFPAK